MCIPLMGTVSLQAAVCVSHSWALSPCKLLYVYPIHGHCLLASFSIIYHAHLFLAAVTMESSRYGPENGTRRRRRSRCHTRTEPFSRSSGTQITTVAHSTMTLHSSFWILRSHWVPMCSQFVCPSRMRSLMAAVALRLAGGLLLLVSANSSFRLQLKCDGTR